MDSDSLFRVFLVCLLAGSDGARNRRPVFSGSVQENRPAGTKVNGLTVHLNRLSPEPWCSKVAGRRWHLQLSGEDDSHFELYFHHRYAQLSLRTARQLDRELRSKYMLRLGLCCKLCLSPEHTVTELALLTVHVLDLNDNAPQFSPTNLSMISLDVTTRLKSEVYKVSAEDADQGTNADLVYFADPVSNYFFVIPKTGQVVLVESILNLKKSVNLTIFARDHGQPPLISAPLEVEISPRMKKFGAVDKEEVTRLKRSLSVSSSPPSSAEGNTRGSFLAAEAGNNNLKRSLVSLDSLAMSSSGVMAFGSPLEVQQMLKPVFGDTHKIRDLFIANIEDLEKPKHSTFTLNPSATHEDPTGGSYTITTLKVELSPRKKSFSLMDKPKCPPLSSCSSAVSVQENTTDGSSLEIQQMLKPVSVATPSGTSKIRALSIASIESLERPKHSTFTPNASTTHKDPTGGSYTTTTLKVEPSPRKRSLSPMNRPKCPPLSSCSSAVSVQEDTTVGSSLEMQQMLKPISGGTPKIRDISVASIEVVERPKYYTFTPNPSTTHEDPTGGSYTTTLNVEPSPRKKSFSLMEGPLLSSAVSVSEDSTIGSPLKVDMSSRIKKLVTPDSSTTHKDTADDLVTTVIKVEPSPSIKTFSKEDKDEEKQKGPKSSLQSTTVSDPEGTTVASNLEAELYPRVKELTVVDKEEGTWEQNRLKRSPVSPDSFSAVSIPEDTPVGSIITTLVSRELQSPWYELVSPSPEDSPVAVNRDNGNVLLISTLDRESQDSYEFLIKEQEKAGKAWHLIHLQLTVTDVNDEAPQWTMEPFPYMAAVSPLAPAGTCVYRLRADDEDEGPNGEVEYFLLGGGGERFSVDRSSGCILTTGKSLEEDAEYQLTVEAADKSGRQSPAVSLSVIAGVRPPQFRNASYTVYVSENTPAGHVLGMVSALSHQNRTLSYSLVSNPHNLFTIHHLNGEVSMTKSMDYETEPHLFLLLVRASEDHQSLTSTAEVAVVITDVNDCAPEFQQTIYSKEGVPETVPPASTLLQVTATDCDTGANGEYSYFTLSPDFSISEQGVISPARGLDYERPGHLYEFIILAIDRGEPPNTGTATVRVRVSNVNDEAPEFSQAVYRTFVSEDAAPNTLVATVQAFDPDGDRVTYEISEGNKEGNFVIDPQKGLIRLGPSPLPQLHGTEYILYVTAADDNASGGAQSLTSTATVIVRVDDINNNKPIFHQCAEYSKNASILENQPPGTFVLQVEAKDADNGVNGQVKYGIVHREGYLPAFTIHPDTGIITTLQTFDREKDKEYPLTIKATDQASEPLISLCQINIAILDQNDNDPSFENNRYEYFLKEDTPFGTSFLRIAARDEDYGPNAALTYSLASDEPLFFQINSTTGWLYVNQPISRKSLITQEVIATDGGNRSTRVEVAVRVTDAQNQPPVWQKDKYEIVIPENTLRDTPVVTVKARSLLGDPRVTYNLEEGLVPESNMPVRFYLTVNREDGSASVLVAENLDYETTRNFILKIRAQNVAPVPLAAFTTVYINITDVNDNVPFFSSSIYEASVTEGLELGTFVLQVSASDQDLGLNGEIMYSILEDRSGDHALFHIDPQTGSIYTASVFDRETKTSYLLEVKSSDGSESSRPGKHGQPNSDTAYVRIFISDVNDNPPAFAQSAYYVSADEDQDAGTVVATVSASDPDEGMNANIRYQITSGNIGGVLDVNPETGAILIVHPLDYEEVKVYILTLLASDGKWEDYATVTISVLNKNDEAPVFSLNEYRGSVAEGLVALPVFVLQVSANDPDHNELGGLKYSLHGSGAETVFTITEKTGQIFALQSLDREEHAVWRFVVLATDDDGDGLTGFTDVIIYVQDINDNAPQFLCTFNICNASVIEHSPPSTSVMEMAAIDLDDKNEGQNAILTYSIVPNPFDLSSQKMFTINNETGTIYTAVGDLDREKNDTYLILVEVKDGGGLSTTGTATVTVVDINDHAPRFTQDVWTAVFPETSEVNFKVLQVSAIDEDMGENTLLTFSIIEGDPDQRFSIENGRKNHLANIILKKKLDYENPHERWFNLTLKVEDLEFSSTSQCLIELQDYNDHPPIFSPLVIHVAPFFENITVGSIITQVTATDADSKENGEISYSIQADSDVLEEFYIAQSGSLVVAKSLDRETMSQYALVILAIDKGSPAQTGTATVYLTLLDVNDNGPRFEGLYMPVVWENTAWPQTLRMNESSYLLYVIDADSAGNGPPFQFSLPSDLQNFSDFLLVDHGNNTASIQTQRIFDREREKEFYLPVIVTDSGNPPMSSTNTLMITIGDENDNGHKEGHKEVYAYVHGASRSPVEVGKVFAPDEDDWDNKTFTAVSEMPPNFLLDPNTGTLTMLENTGQGIYNLEVKVSDGVWPDVTSTVRIHVKEIKSDAIFHSASLILTNITAEEFITKDEHGVSKEDRLRKVLTEIVPSHLDNIQFFNLYSEGRVTELRMAVRESSSYHKADKLRSMVIKHKEKIQAAVQTEVFPGDRDFCLRAVCLRSAGCPERSAGGDAPNLVDGGSASFVSVIHDLAAACRCPPSGRARPSCSSLPRNPCLHGGTCVDTASGYRCQCLPQFRGPLCQLTLRSFHGDGYTRFPPIKFCSEVRLSLEFISDQSDGTLLYHGSVSHQDSENSLSVDIIQGALRLTIRQAGGSLLQLHLSESVNITDRVWHRLDVKLRNKAAVLTLDRCHRAVISEKEGVGKRLLSEDRAMCEVQGLMIKEWRVWNPQHVLQLGGMKEAPSPPHPPSASFKGCLRNLIINKQVYDLGAPLESMNSSAGCAICEVSHSAPCEMETRCSGDAGTASCDCLPGDNRHQCERDDTEHLFQPGGFIQYRFTHAFHPQRTHFMATVRTRQSHSTILSLLSRDASEYIFLQVTRGVLTASYNMGDGHYMVPLAGHRLDSGEWCEVSLERLQNEFTLRMSSGSEHGEVTVARGAYKEIKVDPSGVFLGSSEGEEPGFQGCMKDVRLNGYRLPMENQSSSPAMTIKKQGVTRGCTSDVCRSSPCSRGFICTDMWLLHECSCPPGYLLIENVTGQWCLYTACAQSPCKYGTCIPRSDADFSCLCAQGFAGSNCDVVLYTLDPGSTLSTFLITCIGSTAIIAVIAGAVLLSRCKKKRRMNEGVYHVSAYHDEPEDTRQNIFHYNEEGGGEEDQDAFNMTDLHVSLRSSPALSLDRRAKDRRVHSPLSCDYHASDMRKVASVTPALSCSFTSGDFGQYFYDACHDAVYMHSSCDSLKVYDTEGAGSAAGSLSTLTSSGMDSDLEYEDVKAWGPKFYYLSKLYSYTEDDDDSQ
ncbi:neural-cadherin-like [Mantella aurantiaca]